MAAGIIAPSTATAEDRYVYVVNQSTHMVAEVFAHNTDEGGAIVLWANYGGQSEQFKVEPQGDGWFGLVAKHSGKCLGRTLDTTKNTVLQQECSGLSSNPIGTRNLWRTQEIPKSASDCANPNQCFGGSRTVIQNQYGGGRFCLDADNGRAPNPPVQGARLQAWPCITKYSDWNAVNQDWQLVNVQDWGTGPHVH
ncbi:RICIN domain-containing protein [Streptomyces sp. 3211.6]|uniref:RICIN domain-containing protein n=1 Tax=Streptomyces sp. 3211.6 TaxID=1938845 RepID=UPI0029056516|nr:RICIN domain-containing protein [Streptomyces sp. 3211.6]